MAFCWREYRPGRVAAIQLPLAPSDPHPTLWRYHTHPQTPRRARASPLAPTRAPAGLFWYILYVKYGVGTWAAESLRFSWRVHHFWGPGKPWGTVPLLGRPPTREGRVYARTNYLQRLMGDSLTQRRRFHSLNQSECLRHMARLWDELVRGNKSTINDSPGWTPYRSPVLPSNSVTGFELPQATSQGQPLVT